MGAKYTVPAKFVSAAIGEILKASVMRSKDIYTRKKKTRENWVKNEYENDDLENRQSNKFSRQFS